MKQDLLKIVVLLVYILQSYFLPSAFAQPQMQFQTIRQLNNIDTNYSDLNLVGLELNTHQPWNMNFIIQSNESMELHSPEYIYQSYKLINYFLMGLLVDVKDIWVNLSPDESERILDEKLTQTVIGQDLLTQDLILKIISSELLYEHRESLMNQKMMEEGKFWIEPQKADLLIQDNLIMINHYSLMSKFKNSNKNDKISDGIMINEILEELNHLVNHDDSFIMLRQIYTSLILAHWYKKHIKNKVVEYYKNSNKLTGLQEEDKANIEVLYLQYLNTVKNGIFNVVEEHFDEKQQTFIGRQMITGGHQFDNLDRIATALDWGKASEIERNDFLRKNEEKDFSKVNVRFLGLNEKASSPVEDEMDLSISNELTANNFIKYVRENSGLKAFKNKFDGFMIKPNLHQLIDYYRDLTFLFYNFTSERLILKPYDESLEEELLVSLKYYISNPEIFKTEHIQVLFQYLESSKNDDFQYHTAEAIYALINYNWNIEKEFSELVLNTLKNTYLIENSPLWKRAIFILAKLERSSNSVINFRSIYFKKNNFTLKERLAIKVLNGTLDERDVNDLIENVNEAGFIDILELLPRSNLSKDTINQIYLQVKDRTLDQMIENLAHTDNRVRQVSSDLLVWSIENNHISSEELNQREEELYDILFDIMTTDPDGLVCHRIAHAFVGMASRNKNMSERAMNDILNLISDSDTDLNITYIISPLVRIIKHYHLNFSSEEAQQDIFISPYIEGVINQLKLATITTFSARHRMYAVKAMASLFDTFNDNRLIKDSIVDSLITAFNDNSPFVRSEAIVSIVKRGGILQKLKPFELQSIIASINFNEMDEMELIQLAHIFPQLYKHVSSLETALSFSDVPSFVSRMEHILSDQRIDPGEKEWIRLAESMVANNNFLQIPAFTPVYVVESMQEKVFFQINKLKRYLRINRKKITNSSLTQVSRLLDLFLEVEKTIKSYLFDRIEYWHEIRGNNIEFKGRQANVFDIHADERVMDELIFLVKEGHIDDVIFHGDLFDKGARNQAVWQKIVEVQALLKRKKGSFKLIVGNHDALLIQAMLFGGRVSKASWLQNGGFTLLKELGIPIDMVYLDDLVAKAQFGDRTELNSYIESIFKLPDTQEEYLADKERFDKIFKLMEMAYWVFQNISFFEIDKYGWLHVHAGVPLDAKGNPLISRNELQGYQDKLVEFQKQFSVFEKGSFQYEDINNMRSMFLENKTEILSLMKKTNPLYWIRGWTKNLRENWSVFSNFLEQYGIVGVMFGHAHHKQLFNMPYRTSKPGEVSTGRIFGSDVYQNVYITADGDGIRENDVRKQRGRDHLLISRKEISKRLKARIKLLERLYSKKRMVGFRRLPKKMRYKKAKVLHVEKLNHIKWDLAELLSMEGFFYVETKKFNFKVAIDDQKLFIEYDNVSFEIKKGMKILFNEEQGLRVDENSAQPSDLIYPIDEQNFLVLTEQTLLMNGVLDVVYDDLNKANKTELTPEYLASRDNDRNVNGIRAVENLLNRQDEVWPLDFKSKDNHTIRSDEENLSVSFKYDEPLIVSINGEKVKLVASARGGGSISLHKKGIGFDGLKRRFDSSETQYRWLLPDKVRLYSFNNVILIELLENEDDPIEIVIEQFKDQAMFFEDQFEFTLPEEKGGIDFSSLVLDENWLQGNGLENFHSVDFFDFNGIKPLILGIESVSNFSKLIKTSF